MMNHDKSPSLTRDQWCEMWESIKRIEQISHNFLKAEPTKSAIKYEVNKIKTLIQDVIGKME
jgi:hypothetical protein